MNQIENEPKLAAEELFKPSIIYSDIKVKMGYIDTLYSLISGFVLLADLYGKYLSVIFSTIEGIKESDTNGRKMVKIYTKNYVEELDQKLKKLEDDTSIYRYISNSYSIEVDDKENNLEYSQSITLSRINDAYRTLVIDIRSFLISNYASSNKDLLNKLDLDIKRIFDEIISLEDDIIAVFINDSFDISKVFYNHVAHINSKGLIKTIKDVSVSSNNTLDLLNNTYKALTDMLRGLLYTIDIADPMGFILQSSVTKEKKSEGDDFF